MTSDREERANYCLTVARELWPHLADSLAIAVGHDAAVLRVAGGVVLIDINQHPHAFEALEQALQALRMNTAPGPLPQGMAGTAIDVLRRSWWMDEESAINRMLCTVLSSPTFEEDRRALLESDE